MAESGGMFGRKKRVPIPIPHRTISEVNGQDLDFVNVAHSHLVHSDWDKLNLLAINLSCFRVKHVLLRIKKDHVLSLEFFNWVNSRNPNSLTLDARSMILHVLTRNGKFKSAESILKAVLDEESGNMPGKLFEALLYSYRMCDSSPRVFDLLFKTYAHMKKVRNATDTFHRMKMYGFLPAIESCNAYLSSLLDLRRFDIAFVFYREMIRCGISANTYTCNMLLCAFCKSGKLKKAIELFREMETMTISPNVTSYNTLIAGHCSKGLLHLALKLKNSMRVKRIEANVVTFNTLICGFTREGKLHEANKVLSDMKAANVLPNIITYNTLINGYSQIGNSDMSGMFHEEMLKNGIKADILTYNALILGFCKQGKTRKAAYLVKELEKLNLVPNASTFSALVLGQCTRGNPDRAFQLYQSMVKYGCHPNHQTFMIMASSFCRNHDYEGAVQVITEMCQRCMSPDVDTLTEIFHGLSCCGNEALAKKLCSDMETRHLLPETIRV